MDRRFSLYLDGIRLLGALMVLFAHWALPASPALAHVDATSRFRWRWALAGLLAQNANRRHETVTAAQ